MSPLEFIESAIKELLKAAAWVFGLGCLPAWFCYRFWSKVTPNLSVAVSRALIGLPWAFVGICLLAGKVWPAHDDQLRGIAAAPPTFVIRSLDGIVDAKGFDQSARHCIAFVLHSTPVFLTFGAPVWLYLYRRLNFEATSYGSAKWGTTADANRVGSLIKRGWVGGLMMGRMTKAVPWGRDGRYRTWKHVLTCAPTGAGKGIGCVIPNLLHYPGSILCLDVKGENYAVTARARRAKGDHVICLDPFGITGQKPDAFNWLADLDLTGPECLSDAASIAEALVIRSHTHADAHWDDAAAHLLQGLILYVASLPGTDRHPGTLRALVAQPEADLLRLCQLLGTKTQLAYGLVARAATSFLSKAEKERSGVLSTVNRHTHFLDDPRLVQTSANPAFSFDQLKTSAATVYVVLPPDKLRFHARFARLIFSQAMRAMTQTPGQSRHPVLFLIDEFAQLGHFAAIEDAISILRGYGVTLWLLVQDLSQLQSVYPKWRTFLANSTLQAFGSQDYATTEHISRLLGQQTIEVQSISHSRLRTRSHKSTTTHDLGRALMTPDEIRQFGSHLVLVFEQGCPPYCLRRLNYLTDRQSRRYFDENPLHRPMSG